MKTLIGLTLVAGLCVGAVTFSSGPARAVTTPGGLGSKIAFTRTEVALPGSEDSDQAEIWVMNGDGTRTRQLTHDNGTFDLGAVWSPDGQTIAFYSFSSAVQAHVFLIAADGGEQQPLNVDMPSRFPSWSSQGKIAFDNGGDIFVVNPDGSGLDPLTGGSPTARNIRPDWSPNGQKIAFVSRRSIDRLDHIYVMNAEGSDVTQLTSAGAADNAPAWSPNGQQIVSQRNLGAADGGTEIYTMNADGSDQTRVTTHEGRDQDPDWSPDGRTIAFERDADPISDQTFQVFEMNPDGSDLRQLTGLDFAGDPSENNHPGWGRGLLREPVAAAVDRSTECERDCHEP